MYWICSQLIPNIVKGLFSGIFVNFYITNYYINVVSVRVVVISDT